MKVIAAIDPCAVVIKTEPGQPRQPDIQALPDLKIPALPALPELPGLANPASADHQLGNLPKFTNLVNNSI